MNNIIKLNRPRPTRYDHLAECMFDCLPANSREEIKDRMWQKHKERLTINDVSQVLLYVRKHPDRVGYNVWHSQRGPRKEDSKGYRFFAALTDKNGQRHVDPGTEGQMIFGLISTIKNVVSLSVHEADAIDTGRRYLASPTAQRAARAYVKQLKRLAEDGEDLLKDIGVG